MELFDFEWEVLFDEDFEDFDPDELVGLDSYLQEQDPYEQ